LKTYSAPELINIGTGEDLFARIDLASGNRQRLPYWLPGTHFILYE
jgi:hypothetical protein